MIKDEGLTRDEVVDLENLIKEFKDLFTDRSGKTNITTHDIELTSDEPVQVKPYRVSPRQVDLIRAKVERMLNFGVTEAGDSGYASPMIMVKAPGKQPPPCIDYRRLNAKTRGQLYPIPNIEERIETVSRARYISTVDLIRGYWQVPLKARASRYAAFVTSFGSYHPLCAQFRAKE